MRLVIDASAWQDLDDIGSWIARDNPTAARQVLTHILRATERVQDFPHLSRSGRAKGTREYRVTGTPYVLVFQMQDSAATILITAVVHAARDR